jgi:Ca2+-dependent lipid-binding protein
MASPATKCIVSVLAARGVKAADRGGTSDPYAIFKFESSVNKAITFKTRVRKKTLDPEWRENFVMYVVCLL